MYFVINILSAVNWLLSLYGWVVIAACVVSWVNADPYNPIVRALRTLTEPAFWRIRKYLPFTYVNGLDLSPLVLLLGLKLFQWIVIGSLIQTLMR